MQGSLHQTVYHQTDGKGACSKEADGIFDIPHYNTLQKQSCFSIKSPESKSDCRDMDNNCLKNQEIYANQLVTVDDGRIERTFAVNIDKSTVLGQDLPHKQDSKVSWCENIVKKKIEKNPEFFENPGNILTNKTDDVGDNNYSKPVRNQVKSTSYDGFQTALVETVANNLMKYTKKDIDAAEKAKRLFSILGKPALKDFITMIRTNAIKNCPLTVNDVYRAISIWGEDLGIIQGRTVRSKPLSISRAEVPNNEPQDTSIFIDLFFINKLVFLLSISQGFNLLVVRFLNDKKANSAETAISDIIATYLKHNVIIKRIVCDGESGISALKSKIESKGIALEQCSKNEHVGIIERAGRQMKERVRAFITTLPYTLTNEMLIYLVYYVIYMINYFPKSTTYIEGVAPKTKLTGNVLDYNIDCQLEFGEFVHANEDNSSTNSMKSRTFPAIALGPVGNVYGSYYFLNLET
jgi:hypothetical protein